MSKDLSNKQVKQMIEEMQNPNTESEKVEDKTNEHCVPVKPKTLAEIQEDFENVKKHMNKVNKEITQEQRKICEGLGYQTYICLSAIGVRHRDIYDALRMVEFYGGVDSLESWASAEYYESLEKKEKMRNVVTLGLYKKKKITEFKNWVENNSQIVKALGFATKIDKRAWAAHYPIVLMTILKLENKSLDDVKNVKFLYSKVI